MSIKRTALFDDNKTIDKLHGKENVLYERVRRQDGSQFLKRVKPNETMTAQSLEIALRNLTPLEVGSNYTEVLHPTTPRRIDDDIRFDTDGLEVARGKGRYIFGVMLGMDGGNDNMVYQVVPHSPGFDLSKVVPFRYVETGAESAITTTPEGRDEFYGNYTLRNEVTYGGKTYGAYLVKRLAFDIEVTDASTGLDITGYPDENVLDTGEVKVTGTTNFDITKDDLIEYASVVDGNPNGRRYNTVMFVSGTPVTYTLNGNTYREYRNVIVSHKINLKTVYMGKNDVRPYTYEQRY